MSKDIIKYILLVIICLGIILPRVANAQSNKILEKNNQAIVLITTYDEKDKPLSQGNGFVVRSDGAIVANLHILNKAATVKVKIAKDKYLEVEGILYCDASNDLVILKAKGEELTPVNLGDSDKIKAGDKVHVIFNPAGSENIISEGNSGGFFEITSRQKIIQIDTPVPSANSGAPVFNDAGDVIGIATILLKDAQNLNLAMPINLVKTRVNNKEIIPLGKTIAQKYLNTAEYCFLKGYYLNAIGQYKEAIESYKEAVRIKPDFAEAHYNIGNSSVYLGDAQKAIESYKETIRLKPNYAEAHFGLGSAYAIQNEYKKAIDSYKEAICLKPDYAKAYLSLGFAYSKFRNYNKAIESYKEAIRLNPNNPDAHYNLGIIYGEMSKYPEALELFKETVRLKPDDADAHYGLGFTYMMMGNFDGASKEAEILKELNQELSDELFKLISEEKDGDKGH